MDSLWQKCKDSVGHHIRFKGTNGDEYDKDNHGKPIEGTGFCDDFHDSHGLCLDVTLQDGDIIYVDPIEVEILKTRKVLGYTFREFDECDKDAYCGAEKGSLICYENGMCLILSPDGTISEMQYGPDGEDEGQIDWTPNRV
ncbi:hypothetical protein C4565_00655 [Candidatus Parcubacteria bacterium]|nr:MAG: hypothetical protein C4565_00655 [Candidatus Parcubacteria bacterium]